MMPKSQFYALCLFSSKFMCQELNSKDKSVLGSAWDWRALQPQPRPRRSGSLLLCHVGMRQEATAGPAIPRKDFSDLGTVNTFVFIIDHPACGILL